MIVIAYDGSPDAQAAVERAGELMKGQAATVLTIWERFIDVMTRAGAGMPVGEINYEALDRDYEEEARRRAIDGAERAERAGLAAQARLRVRRETVSSTILDEADELEAGAIVVGRRGLTGLKSLLLGSVSNAIVQHADIPVLVVPSDSAAERTGRRR